MPTNGLTRRWCLVTALAAFTIAVGVVRSAGTGQSEAVHAAGPVPGSGSATEHDDVVRQAPDATGTVGAPTPLPTEAPAAAAAAGVVSHGPAERQGAAAAAATPPIPAVPRKDRGSAGDVDEGEDTSPGRYHETPDAGNYFVYPGGPRAGAGLAKSERDGPERLRFSVYVGVTDATGSVSARLTNVSGREMRFADGLRVVATVTRDGQPYREIVLTDPALVSMAPGQKASLEASFTLDGPGQYSGWGSVDIELV